MDTLAFGRVLVLCAGNGTDMIGGINMLLCLLRWHLLE